MTISYEKLTQQTCSFSKKSRQLSQTLLLFLRINNVNILRFGNISKFPVFLTVYFRSFSLFSLCSGELCRAYHLLVGQSHVLNVEKVIGES